MCLSHDDSYNISPSVFPQTSSFSTTKLTFQIFLHNTSRLKARHLFDEIGKSLPAL